jgi:hypothetical protein
VREDDFSVGRIAFQDAIWVADQGSRVRRFVSRKRLRKIGS